MFKSKQRAASGIESQFIGFVGPSDSHCCSDGSVSDLGKPPKLEMSTYTWCPFNQSQKGYPRKKHTPSCRLRPGNREPAVICITLPLGQKGSIIRRSARSKSHVHAVPAETLLGSHTYTHSSLFWSTFKKYLFQTIICVVPG